MIKLSVYSDDVRGGGMEMCLRTASAMVVESRKQLGTRTQDTPGLILGRPQGPLTATVLSCPNREGRRALSSVRDP
jgi:hypothetical protein